MADENQLRRDLRFGWDAKKFGELIWVEHARGGTVGAPDVMVPLGGKNGYCPVELKWWEVLEGGIIAMTARPAQKRFHLLAWRAGQRSAYLAELSSGDYVLLPGHRLELETVIERIENRRWMQFLQLRNLKSLLLDENFWKGMK